MGIEPVTGLVALDTKDPAVYTSSCHRIYSPVMHKTTLVVDDKKIARARKLLGTKGIRDTLDRALDEVIALDARRRVIERLRTMEGIDEQVLRNVRKEAWR